MLRTFLRHVAALSFDFFLTEFLEFIELLWFLGPVLLTLLRATLVGFAFRSGTYSLCLLLNVLAAASVGTPNSSVAVQ